MPPTLERLEQYLTDCENKRRRARDRPSNRVVEELRALLDEYRAATARRPRPPAFLDAKKPGTEGSDVPGELERGIN